MKQPHFRLLIVLCLFGLVQNAFAQPDQLKVVPKKVFYKRTGHDVPEYKRTFEVRYPIIKTKLKTGVRKKIEHAIDYWKVFDMNLSENLRGYHWLSSFDYEIKYNKNNILDIWMTMEGVGAYPDSATRYIVLDIRKGKKLTWNDMFLPTKLAGLRDLIRRKMLAEEANLDPDFKNGLRFEREQEVYREYNPGPDRLQLKDLEGFSVSDKGVMFIYDYGYAHISQATEPPGEFFLTYSELKPFIRPDGLLARFIR